MVVDDATDDQIGYEFLVFLPVGFKRWLKLLGKFARALRKYPSASYGFGRGGN
jgi:hypothetical protein